MKEEMKKKSWRKVKPRRLTVELEQPFKFQWIRFLTQANGQNARNYHRNASKFCFHFRVMYFWFNQSFVIIFDLTLILEF